MARIMSFSTFLRTELAAHAGAFGAHSKTRPTEAQLKANNYAKGKVKLYGLPITIEQPRGSFRTGMDEDLGKEWATRLAAHYGYINGTRGADGDHMDCFIGPLIVNDPACAVAYVINQQVDGAFDEHKVMLGFGSDDEARLAYMQSYERGWPGLESVVKVTITQLKWWLGNGDMTRPLSAADLPKEETTMTRRLQWAGDEPIGFTLDKVLYEIRRSDAHEGLLFDAVTMDEILADADEEIGDEEAVAFDALVMTKNQMPRRIMRLQQIMERAAHTVKPIGEATISNPFKQRGAAHIAVVFELSDGQTITIYFHNPDSTPTKIKPTDELISWKWLLNKKDITIVVAPERGQDLNIREVARRVMRLAEKNSAAFKRHNAKRAERMASIETLKTEIAQLESELKTAQNRLDVAKIEAEDRREQKAREKANAPSYAEQVKAMEAEKDEVQKQIAALLAGAYANYTNLKLSPKAYATVKNDAHLLQVYGDGLRGYIAQRARRIFSALEAIGWKHEEDKHRFVKGRGKAKIERLGNSPYDLYVIGGVEDDLTKTPEEFAAAVDRYNDPLWHNTSANGDELKANYFELLKQANDFISNEIAQIGAAIENGENPKVLDARVSDSNKKVASMDSSLFHLEDAYETMFPRSKRKREGKKLLDSPDAQKFRQLHEQYLQFVGEKVYPYIHAKSAPAPQPEATPQPAPAIKPVGVPTPPEPVAAEVVRFEVGKSYYGRWVTNSDSIVAFRVVSRTEKSIRVDMLTGDEEKGKQLRITEYEGAENVSPLGSYSMAPIVSADRELTPDVKADNNPLASKQVAEIDYDAMFTPQVMKELRDSVTAAKNEGNTETRIDSDRILSLFSETLTPAQYRMYDHEKAEDVLFAKLAEIEREMGLNEPVAENTSEPNRVWDKPENAEADPAEGSQIIAAWDSAKADALFESETKDIHPHAKVARKFIGRHMQGRIVKTKIGDCVITRDSSNKLAQGVNRANGVKFRCVPRIPEVLIDGNVNSAMQPIEVDQATGKPVQRKDNIDGFYQFRHILTWPDKSRADVGVKVGSRKNEQPPLVYTLTASRIAALDAVNTKERDPASPSTSSPVGTDVVCMGYSGASKVILDDVSGSVNAGFDDLNITVYAAWDKDGNRVPEFEDGDESLPPPDADKPSAAQPGEMTGPAKDRMAALKVLTSTGMNRWMPEVQNKAVIAGLMGEEWQFFYDKMKELANVIATMPKTYEQDGKGNTALAYLHYFRGGADWYITEKDKEGDGTQQAFGYTDLGQGGELGYISIDEVLLVGGELDFHWQTKTLGAIKSEEEPEPPPAPETTSADADKALLQQIVDGTADPLTVDLATLEAIYERNQSDPDMQALFEEAVNKVIEAENKATATV
jgi:hypothetical protein